jgi:hypothetical protein
VYRALWLVHTLTGLVGDCLPQDVELDTHLVEGLHEPELLGLPPSMIIYKVVVHEARLLTLPRLVRIVIHLSFEGLL